MAEFVIVCEVSANRRIDWDTFIKQLEGAFNHCVEVGKEHRRDRVMFGLLVNPAKNRRGQGSSQDIPVLGCREEAQAAGPHSARAHANGRLRYRREAAI